MKTPIKLQGFDNSYAYNQIMALPVNVPFYRLQISADGGAVATNHLNITHYQARKIAAILNEKECK